MLSNMYYAGTAVEGLDTAIDVINPATKEIVASCKSASFEQVNDAVEAAKVAFSHWKDTSDSDVDEILTKIANDIAKEKSDIAKIITVEQGKPYHLAELEVDLALYWIDEIKKYQIPVTNVTDAMGKKMEVHNRPLGIIASITPWNWPFVIAIWHIIPALKTKNCVINKPSEFTPLSTIRLIEIINRHVPKGVCNVVLGGGIVGKSLTENPLINKVIFTGSTRTGQSILNGTVNQFKKVVLELGGNDAAIVLDDVDVDNVAQKVFQSAFFNAGQTCACIKRLYVDEKIYDSFVQKLCEIADQQTVGNGLIESTTIGPVQNRIQFEKVNHLLKDALDNGAKILNNPKQMNSEGYFIFPTLVGNINENTDLFKEEQFGPVLPVVSFSSEDDLLKRVNNSDYGLGGSIWTQNLEKAYEIASKLECGTVWINSHADVSPLAEFGGWKTSGQGYTFGLAGLLAYTKKQAIHCTV